MRNPRRTARTAAALMIGLMLVSTIAVLGDSLSASAANSVDTAINADYIISGKGGFSRSVVPAVGPPSRGVTTTTVVYQGQFEFRGSLSTLTRVSTQPPVADDRPARDHTAAAPRPWPPASCWSTPPPPAPSNLHVGSVVPVRFAQTGPATMRVGGIFKPNPLAGSYFVGDRYFLLALRQSAPNRGPAQDAPGTRTSKPPMNRILDPYAERQLQDPGPVRAVDEQHRSTSCSG